MQREFIQYDYEYMYYYVRHAHILDTPILGPAAKAAPTAPCAPGLSGLQVEYFLQCLSLQKTVI